MLSRKNIMFKFLVLMIALQASMTIAEEEESPIETLHQLLLGEILSISIDKEVLLNDQGAVVLSQGVWMDQDVAAFKIKYKKLPIVLPLTRKIKTPESESTVEKEGIDSASVETENEAEPVEPVESILSSSGSTEREKPTYTDQQLEAMLFAGGNSQDIMYLYIKLPDSEEDKSQLVEELSSLYEESFQSSLEDNDFSRLPATFQKKWLVKLGLQEPEFPGGYN